MKNTLWQKALLLLFVCACKSSGSRKERGEQFQSQSLIKGRAVQKGRGSQAKSLKSKALENANSSTGTLRSQDESESFGSGTANDTDQFFDSLPPAVSNPTDARKLEVEEGSSGGDASQTIFSAPHVNVPAVSGAGSGGGVGSGGASSSESSPSDASLAPRQEETPEKSKCLQACEAMIKGYTNNHEYMEKISSRSEDMSIFSLDIRREANVVWEGCGGGSDAGDSARSELNAFLKECKGGVTTKVASCLSKNIIFRDTGALSAEKRRQLLECRKSMKRASGKSQNAAKKSGGAAGTSPH